MTYTLAKGEKVKMPDDPSPNSEKPAWYFIDWLVWKSSIDSCRNGTKEPTDDVIKNNTYDFSQQVMDDIHLFTSWTTKATQHFYFTIENEVQNNSQNEEFTYTIAITDEKLVAKKNGKNSVLDPDPAQWSEVTTTLRNNQQYKVRIDVTYANPGWNGHRIEITVLDKDDVVIASGIRTLYPGQSKPGFTSDYKYTMTITQATRVGYTSSVEVTENDNDVTCRTNNLTFTFSSSECNSTTTKDAITGRPFTDFFQPEVNGYEGGASNYVTIHYCNVGSETILPAPTNYTSNRLPYFLMMLVGILMLTCLGGVRIIRKKKRLPDAGFVSERDQSHKQRDEYKTPLARGALPSVPPCPRAYLWAKSSGSDGKRGDPGL